MWRVLVLWKPTLEMRESRCCGVAERMLGIVRVEGWDVGGVASLLGRSSVCKRCMAAAVTGSLVWEESMRAVRVW